MNRWRQAQAVSVLALRSAEVEGLEGIIVVFDLHQVGKMASSISLAHVDINMKWFGGDGGGDVINLLLFFSFVVARLLFCCLFVWLIVVRCCLCVLVVLCLMALVLVVGCLCCRVCPCVVDSSLPGMRRLLLFVAAAAAVV